MADVLHRATKELILSVNTPDYPLADWCVVTDRAAVQAIERKYRVIDGATIREATTQEKASIDAAEEAEAAASRLAELQLARAEAKELIDSGSTGMAIAVRAAMKVTANSMGELRQGIGQPPKTWAQVVAAAKAVIDAGQADQG